MPFVAQLPAAILDTVVGRLALIFLIGAGGDLDAARTAAVRMLATYQPDNEHELRLAAQIISFSFHSLEALSQADGVDLPLNHKLRLYNAAASLSRESNVAQKRLDQCQDARRSGIPVEPPVTTATQTEPPQLPPKIEKALDLIKATRETTVAASTSGQTWTQAYDQRQRDKRLQARQITEKLRNNHAHQTAQANASPVGLPVMTAQPDPVIEQTMQR